MHYPVKSHFMLITISFPGCVPISTCCRRTELIYTSQRKSVNWYIKYNTMCFTVQSVRWGVDDRKLLFAFCPAGSALSLILLQLTCRVSRSSRKKKKRRRKRWHEWCKRDKIGIKTETNEIESERKIGKSEKSTIWKARCNENVYRKKRRENADD